MCRVRRTGCVAVSNVSVRAGRAATSGCRHGWCHHGRAVHGPGARRAARAEVSESTTGRWAPGRSDRQPPGRPWCRWPIDRSRHLGAHQRTAPPRAWVRPGRADRPQRGQAARRAVPAVAAPCWPRPPDGARSDATAARPTVPGAATSRRAASVARRRRGHHRRHAAQRCRRTVRVRRSVRHPGGRGGDAWPGADGPCHPRPVGWCRRSTPTGRSWRRRAWSGSGGCRHQHRRGRRQRRGRQGTSSVTAAGGVRPTHRVIGHQFGARSGGLRGGLRPAPIG